MNQFDKLVYYQLCDFMYDEFISGAKSKGIGYQTFYNMCESMSTKVINNTPFFKLEGIIINKSTGRLCEFFGLTDSESALYMYELLKSRIWIKIYDSICTVNSVFSLAKNI